MRAVKNILLLTLSLLTFVTAQSQNFVGKKKDIDSILKNIENFSQSYMNGDHEKIANAYTADGMIFPNRTDILKGTAALDKYWTLPKDIKVQHHKVAPVEITIVKKTAYDYGYYEGKTLLADGTTSSWKGKYVIIWKKVDGEWKIYADIWNSMAMEEK